MAASENQAALAPAAPETPSSMPSTPMTPGRPSFIPLVTVVGFHHARGPEVENWFGAPDGIDPAVEYEWTLLPFMALSDGAHASDEDFSYFTLLRPATDSEPATSLFGISCTRQLDASKLLNRPEDVTRSTVQKAVVVIADSPQYFGMMRERLSVVTQAWFAQLEFTDTEILRRFQESLAEEKERGMLQEEEDRDQYLGMSLRELVKEFRWQTLVLLKCCLLQPKMLFFGSRCERLCMMQFSLISLIPRLIRNLQDCADPELNAYEKKLQIPTTLRTSDRNSLLTYMGLPLQVFAKGSLLGPYTPLQQLDVLADFGTKSYIVGSTNSLLLQQKDRYSDILINLDENSVNITSASLRQALTLSAADRRWIDYLTQEVNETWDDTNPGRPKTMGYVGSEEFIRLQFEEYILALLSSFKYHKYLLANQNNPRALLPHIEYDPALDFGTEFIHYWSATENHRMWNAHTDSHLFDVVEPRHPCAGGLTIDDIQRRIGQQVQDMHLDERFAQGREVLGRNFAAGREKASTMFNKLYSDMESYREAQRQRAMEQQQQQDSQSGSPRATVASEKSGDATQAQRQSTASWGSNGVDVNRAQQNVQTAGSKAGAYMGSWVTWAGEKRKGWGTGWGRSKSDKNGGSSSPGVLSPRDSMSVEKEGRFSGSFFGARNSSNRDVGNRANGETDEKRPTTGGSFSESIFSAAGTTESDPASPGKSRSGAPMPGDDGTMDAVLEIKDVTPPQELPVLSAPSSARAPSPSTLSAKGEGEGEGEGKSESGPEVEAGVEAAGAKDGELDANKAEPAAATEEPAASSPKKEEPAAMPEPSTADEAVKKEDNEDHVDAADVDRTGEDSTSTAKAGDEAKGESDAEPELKADAGHGSETESKPEPEAVVEEPKEDEGKDEEKDEKDEKDEKEMKDVSLNDENTEPVTAAADASTEAKAESKDDGAPAS